MALLSKMEGDCFTLTTITLCLFLHLTSQEQFALLVLLECHCFTFFHYGKIL